MAVLAVYEQLEESGARNADGYSFDRNFIVSMDGPSNVMTVLEAAKIPRRGDLHPSGKSSCSAVNATNDGDLWWTVVATYEPVENASGGGGEGENSVGVPTMTISSRGRQVSRRTDIFGTILCNSAGDAFEPDVFDESSTVITITVNVPFELITFQLIEAWRGVVHAGPMNARIVQDPEPPENVIAGNILFFGFKPGVVRCVDIGAAQDNSGNQSRWDLHVQFEVASSWIGTALDQGVHQTSEPAISKGIQGSQGQANIRIVDRTPILDGNGVPVVRPVLLNGEGKPLENDAAWYVVWQRHQHKDLNLLLRALNLPTSLAEYKVVRT